MGCGTKQEESSLWRLARAPLAGHILSRNATVFAASLTASPPHPHPKVVVRGACVLSIYLASFCQKVRRPRPQTVIMTHYYFGRELIFIDEVNSGFNFYGSLQASRRARAPVKYIPRLTGTQRSCICCQCCHWYPAQLTHTFKSAISALPRSMEY